MDCTVARRRVAGAAPHLGGVGCLLTLLVVAGALSASVQAAPAGAVPPNMQVDLAALERAFQQIAERVSPSVVSIRAHRRQSGQSSWSEPEGDSGQSVITNGTGIVVRADGSILTNEHVIHGAWQIDVILNDGTTRRGTVTASDQRTDLAVLRVDGVKLTPVTVCRWDSVQRGQWSIAVGNPFGLGNDGKLCVSVGVISNLGRRLPGLGEADDRLYVDMIQTTASIHPGNSGGPLFNIQGELVGVVTAVHARAVDDEGVGFAIPMTPGRWQIVESLLAGRPVEHGYIGLTVRELEPAERSAAGLGGNQGVYVERVDPGGPAEQAGLRCGDILLRYGQDRIDEPMDLAERIGTSPVGQSIALEVRRGDAHLDLQTTIGRRQIQRVDWMRGATAQAP